MATYYWVGLGANTNASTTGNWSLSSGGIPQASVPSGSDKAQFDGGYSVQVVHDEGADNFTLINHGLNDNDRVYMRPDTIADPEATTLPAPYIVSTVYYVVASDANTFQLSLTLGGAPIDQTEIGDLPTVNIYTKSKNCSWDITNFGSGQIFTSEDYTSTITFGNNVALGALSHQGGTITTDYTSGNYYVLEFPSATPQLGSNRKHIELGPKGRLGPNKKYWTWQLLASSTASAPLLFDSGEYPHIIIHHASTGYVSPQYSTMTNTTSEEVRFRSLYLKAGASDILFQPYGNPTDNDYKMKFTLIEHHNAHLGYHFRTNYGLFDGGVATWTFQASQGPSFLFPVYGYYNATYYGKSNESGDMFFAYFHNVIISSDSYGAGGVCQLVAPYNLSINELTVESGAMFLGGSVNGTNSTIRCRKTPIIRGSWNFTRINDGVYSTGTDKASRLQRTTDVASGGTGLAVLPKGQIMYGNGSNIQHSSNFKYDATNNVLYPGEGLKITENASTPLAVADGEGGLLYVKNTNPTTLIFVDDDGGETTLGAGGGGGSDTTYTISCVDGDNTDEEKIRLTASTGGTDDVVLEAGTGLSIARSGDKITFTNTVTDTDTILSTEQVQDIVGAMFSGNTETNITATYEDSDGTIDLVATDTNTQLSDSEIAAMGYIKNTMSFVLEDDDGTEVSISNLEEIKFHSGNTSIDINYSDITPGSDADPFDLDFRTIHAPYLYCQDDRDFAPEDIDSSLRQIRGFFSTKTGLEDGSTTSGSDYVDVLLLETYNGGSGGDANILVFSKNGTKRMYHYRADQADTNWGTADTIAYTSDIPTTEAIQDIVGAMFTGNTETRISATYEDSDGTIDLVVDDMTGGGGSASDSFKTISVAGQSDVVADSSTDTLTLVGGTNVSITTDAGGDQITFTATDTNTQTTYTPTVVDSSNDALIRLTAGGAGSGTQDIKLVAGTNITLTPDTTTSPQQITIAAAGGGGGGTFTPDHVFEEVGPGATATAQSNKSHVYIAVSADGSGTPHNIPSMSNDCLVTIANLSRSQGVVMFTGDLCYSVAATGPHPAFTIEAGCIVNLSYLSTGSITGSGLYMPMGEHNTANPAAEGFAPM